MQVFMLYMSGSGVQIFSMGIVFMLLLSPFKNVATINTGTAFHHETSMPLTSPVRIKPSPHSLLLLPQIQSP